MPTLKEILTGKVTLDIECVDRVYLNGYVKYLQLPGGLITFIRKQLGFPNNGPPAVPRTAASHYVSQSYAPHTAIERPGWLGL